MLGLFQSHPNFKKNILMILWIQNKIESNSLIMKDVILFHPHFEDIHPFADRNGRIGRLLLVMLLVAKGLPKWLALNMSRVIYLSKEKYFKSLELYATQKETFQWNSFFIDALIKAKHLMEKQFEEFQVLILRSIKISKSILKFLSSIKFIKKH